MKAVRLATACLVSGVIATEAADPNGAHAAPVQGDKSTVSFTVENDSFFGTDRYYTHGFRLQYMHRPNDLPGWATTFLNEFPTLGMDVNRRRVGVALGQEFYTPAHIRRSALQVDDRPYGAWLHGSLILRRAGMVSGDVPVMDEFELDLGVVGPEALGEKTQKWWHKLTDMPEPRGWDHQLETEPAIQLFLTRSFQIGFRNDEYWGVDVVPHGRVALGNMYIYGEVGTMFRAGFNLPLEYVVSPMESFSTHPSYDPPEWSVYAFAGADGRVVGRNIFLDGNSFRDSHSVDKELFVSDLRAGLAVRYKGFETVGSVVHRTREFELQEEDENFLSITFQFHF
ncbi:MAG TPA: lipid A deacylase LpxR family protein [Verrucomicrobiae bacterium]